MVGRPTGKLTNLAATRDGNKFNVSWTVPGRLTDTSTNNYMEWVDSNIDFICNPDSKERGEVWKSAIDAGQKPLATTLNYDHYWVRGLERGGGWTQASNVGEDYVKPYDRNRYYPKTSKKCTGVTFSVWGGNTGSPANKGPAVSTTYRFGIPRKPTVSWEYDPSNSVATVTVKTDEGKDNYERLDTMVRVTIRRQDGKTETLLAWAATTRTEWVWKKDLSTYLAGIISGKYVQIKCEAYSRGMAGASDVVEAIRNIAYPVAATIGTIKCDKKTNTGRIEVPVKPGAYTLELQLQRRNGESGSWTDVSGATDNWDCKALYDTYADANPQPGEYVYYQVKTTRDQYTQYSAIKRADCLYTAKPKVTCSATKGIVSITPHKNGTSVQIITGFTDSTPNDGCELSWSEYGNAWGGNINDSPSTVTADDHTVHTTSHSPKYKHTRPWTLNNLEQGKTYYVRVRRYREVDGETIYSSYDRLGVATPFTMESAEDDECGIASVSCSSDGTSATIVVGINEGNPNTGTEITWSDHSNAWWSNEQPESMNATWGRASYNTGGWTYKQTSYLRGLEPGTTYYLRARRYNEAGGTTTYSGYSKTASFKTPKKSEADPDLRCGLVSVTGGEDGVSAEIVVGWSGDRDGCEVSWSTDSDAWQSSIQPDTATFDWKDKSNRSSFSYRLTSDTAIKSGKSYYTRSGSGTSGSPYVYTRVTNPSASSLGSYYERVYAWAKTGTFYLHGLVEGTTYYVKARSYVDVDGETVWSDYTEDKHVTPFSSPKSVTLTAPSAVARGESIELYWTVEGEIEQTEWRVHRVGYPKTSLARGTGSLCHASIPASRYGSLTSISLYVEAGYGGGLTESNAVTVGIADYPSCECACASILEAQPASFEFYTDDPTTALLATLRADGIAYTGPDGDQDQLEGDVVWTSGLNPDWAEATWSDTMLRTQLSSAVTAATMRLSAAKSAATFSATTDTSVVASKTYYQKSGSDYLPVTPDDGDNPSSKGWYVIADEAKAAEVEAATSASADAQAALAAHPSNGICYMYAINLPVLGTFRDGGSYTMSSQTVEPVAGLQSDISECSLSVDWEHQAVDPPKTVTVVPDKESRSVTITLVPTEDAAETDVYDIYRKLPSGYALVAYGLEMDAVVVDPFAPYGKKADLGYRICTRTADGDTSFADFPYTMDVATLRVDWEGGSVELPYNVGLSESRSKSFGSRKHVDGSITGRWDKAVESKSSYSSDAIAVTDNSVADAVRTLGDYSGACFVRDATGMAFQANVDVADLGKSYDSPCKFTVRLDATAVDTDDTFWLQPGEDGSGVTP